MGIHEFEKQINSPTSAFNEFPKNRFAIDLDYFTKCIAKKENQSEKNFLSYREAFKPQTEQNFFNKKDFSKQKKFGKSTAKDKNYQAGNLKNEKLNQFEGKLGQNSVQGGIKSKGKVEGNLLLDTNNSQTGLKLEQMETDFIDQQVDQLQDKFNLENKEMIKLKEEYVPEGIDVKHFFTMMKSKESRKFLSNKEMLNRLGKKDNLGVSV